MNVLIDILHPAHVHFFRNLRSLLAADGDTVIVTARRKEMSLRLLESYGIDHIHISDQKSGGGLISEMLVRTVRLMRICRARRPSLLMGIMGPSIAVAGRLLRIPAWVFYDTENAWITNWFAYPLATRVYTPACYQGADRRNQIRYPGYHELAYLHPNRFTADPDVLRVDGVDPEAPYSIVRFVGWQASHDIGERGLALDDKIRLVAAIEKHGRVFISSEAPLPPELADRRCPVQITRIHDLIAGARVVVGESATMASEAAVLGVPALFISDTLRGYTVEEERKYGLVWNLSRSQVPQACEIIDRLLRDPAGRSACQEKRRRLLNDTCDVTAYIREQVRGMSRSHGTCAV